MGIQENIKNSLSNNIKNLTGEDALIELNQQVTIEYNNDFIEIIISIHNNDDIVCFVPALCATYLSGLILENKGELRANIEEYDIDAMQSLFENSIKEFENDTQEDASITKTKKATLQDSSSLPSGYKTYSIKIEKLSFESFFIVAVGENFINDTANTGSVTKLRKGEQRNLDLILGAKVEVRARIGSREMFLKDAINMDIGSVIELNKLLNEPIDIMVSDQIIGYGEVVIVDGNFGIRITKILENAHENINSIQQLS